MNHKNSTTKTGTLRKVWLSLIILVTVIKASAQVTVNPGGVNYATVNAAFAAINAGTHTGAVTVQISANTTEPAAPTVLNASGVGLASYTSITIFPTVSGVTVAGTSNASRGVLEFNGADNITINGNLNNGTGSSRDLTIRNNAATTAIHTVLWFQSSATTPQLGCNNISVRNVQIIGNADVSPTRTGTTPYQPLVALSSTTYPTTAAQTGVNNSGFTFDNNEFLRGQVGLHLGQSTAAAMPGVSITNNIFGSTVPADFVTWRAVYLANSSGALIQGNLIQNLKSIISGSSGAIEIAGATSSSVVVRRNVIRGVWNTSTGGWACAGIWFNGGNNHTADNNIIYDLLGANYLSVVTTFNAYGIRLGAGTGHRVWYNSVNLYGTVSSGTAPSTSTALAVGTTTVTGLDIRNNILSNFHVSTVNGFQAFCIRYASGYNFATSGNIVNNNYYSLPASNTATTSYFYGGTYGASVTYSNLVALQTATGQDGQSVPIVNIPAPFTANDNLIIPTGTSTSIESGGTPITPLGLPNTDFTGVTRPAGTGTAPDIGAYEFDGLAAAGCNSAPSSGGTVSAPVTTLCSGNAITINATGYTSDIGIEYNWQISSTAGGPFTDISGANVPLSYNTGPLTADTYYRLRVTCTNTSQSTFSNEVGLIVLNPQLLSTTPGSRCGTGTVTLGASVASGTVNWYTTPTGGLPVGTGTSFTTPVISATTDYYAAASSGGSTFNTSKLTYEPASTATNLTTYGQVFTLTQPITLNSVQVFSTTGTAITISLFNSTGATQLLTTGSVPVTAGSSPNITLGWTIAPGTYRLCANGMTGNFYRDNTGVTYPFALATIGTMNGFVSSITGSVTTSSSYYFMYNWSVSTGCESSPRTLVTATVNTATPISVSAGQNTVCNGANITLSASSANDPNYNYTWSSNPAGFTASGASVNANPTVTTHYIVTANDPGTQCQVIDSVLVTALPSAVTINGAPDAICSSSGSSLLFITPASGYGSATFQWLESPTGSGYTPISGANASTYSTPTLTASTFYQLEIRDPANNLCLSPTKVIAVGVPTLDSSTPASRCGIGTVTLGATVSPVGAVANWYASSTGGAPIGTGNSFVTPVINSTTTYYVAAVSGSTPFNSTIGTQSTTTQAGMPFRAGNGTAMRTQYLYTAAELAAAGLTAGSWNEFRWTVTTAIGAGATMGNMTIRVGHTTATALTATFQASPSTVVYGPVNYVASASLGDIVFPFSNAFNWDGTSNVLIEICHDNPSPTGGSGQVAANASGFNSVAFVGNVCGTAAGATVQATRPIIKISGGLGCESARVPVIATVTPSPALTVTAGDLILCPNGNTNLSVSSSNDPNYSYSWSSDPAGFTASGPGPHTVTPTTTTKYYVSALDNSAGPNAGCAALDSITIITAPTLSGGTITASQTQLCFSGSSNLSLTGFSGGIPQWQASTNSNSGPWTNVGTTGALTYSTGTITQTTWYRVEVTCQGGVSAASSNVIEVTVNQPAIVSTTPGSRCGIGTVNLAATGNSTSVNWYASPTGGVALGTGNNFTTPVIGSTTTYYAAAQSGGSTPVFTGLPNALPTATSGSGTTNFGLVFDALSPFTLQSVRIFPLAAAANTAGTVTIDVIDGSNNILHSAVVNVIGNPIASVVGQTVTLNFQINPGTNLKLRPRTLGTGITGLLFEPSAAAPGGNYGYPYVVPGVVSFNTSTLTAAPTNTPRNDLYYYFYNLEILTGCESPRVPVTATVTPPPAMTLTSTFTAVCTGGSTDISVSSPNDPDYTYTWTSNPAGFTQTGNGPFTVSPTVTTRYIVQAVDNSTGPNAGCVNIDSITVVAGGTLNAGTISASQTSLCATTNNTTTLTLTGAGGGLIEWQSAPSPTGPWTTVQTGGTTYTSPALSQNIYYQVVVSCETTSLTSNQLFIQVDNPSITSTTGGTRCGPGQVTLSATSASPSINWYAQPTGGAPLASGNTFTPNVISTTTFYAAATGGGSSNISVASPAIGTSTFITTTAGWGLRFTVNQSVGISSVTVRALSSSPGAASIQIRVTDLADNILYTGTLHNFTITSTLTDYVIPVNIGSLPVGNYKMGMTYTNITSMVREASGVTFPYNSPGNEVSITAGANGAGTAQTTTAYYWFYNWVISTGCEGVRVPVVATVTPAPSVSLGADVTICNGQITTLTATSSNDPDYSYVWNTGFNGAAYAVSPTATTTYSVVATDTTAGANAGCSARDTIVVTVNPVPVVPSITQNPSVVCGSVPVTLVAASGGPAVAQIGSGTLNNVTAGQTPFMGNFEGSRIQYLFTAAELNAQGISAGLLNSLAFNITTMATTVPMTAYTVKLGHTSASSLSGYQSGLTTVYVAPVPYAPVAGWNTFNFTTPFIWNGSSNLVVEVCHNNDPTGTCTGGSGVCWGGNSTVQATATPFTSIFGSHDDNASLAGFDPCAGVFDGAPTGNGITGVNRPNIRLGHGATPDFLWSTGVANDTLIVTPPLGSTTYSVTATNIFGCTSSNSITVNAANPPKPVIATNDTTLCAPSEIFVKVVDTAAYVGGYPAGTTFAWFDATGGVIVPATPDLDSISSTNSSSFYVVVTLPNFCTATSDTAFVVTKAVAIVPTINNATCSAGGSILATVTSGIAPFQYVWSTDPAQTNVIQTTTTASTTDLLSNLAAGTYYLSVSDEFGQPGSCNSGVIPFVVGGASPIVISVDAQTNVSCNGQADGAVTISYTGGVSPYTVQWSNGQTTTSLAGLSAGTYTVTVSDLSGCADTLEVIITEPTALSATLSSTQESAPGASDGSVTALVSGGTTPYVIDWFDLIPNPVGSGATVTGLTGGFYQVLIVDSNNCQLIDTVEVTTITNATLNLTVLIQGFHDGAGGLVPNLFNAGVGASFTESDSIRVELRDALSPTTVLASETVVLSTTGTATITYPSSVLGNNCYIAVFHRNSVETWSGAPITVGSSNTYNFSTAAAQAFGSNQVELLPGVWAMYSGDIDDGSFSFTQDGFIDIFDFLPLDGDIQLGNFGYVNTDLDGTGFVDAFDFLILDPNIQLGVSKVTP